MRAYGFTALLGMAVLSIPAGSQEPVPVVAIHVTGVDLLSVPEDREMRTVVNAIFARIGARIAWIDGKPNRGDAFAQEPLIHVQFVRLAMGSHSSGALAYASPFAKGFKTITVLCDRIHFVAGSRRRAPLVLAHTLAHELGLVLEGTNRHSQTGIMKALWDTQDFLAMEKAQLEFGSTDQELIGAALKPDARGVCTPGRCQSTASVVPPELPSLGRFQ